MALEAAEAPARPSTACEAGQRGGLGRQAGGPVRRRHHADAERAPDPLAVPGPCHTWMRSVVLGSKRWSRGRSTLRSTRPDIRCSVSAATRAVRREQSSRCPEHRQGRPVRRDGPPAWAGRSAGTRRGPRARSGPRRRRASPGRAAGFPSASLGGATAGNSGRTPTTTRGPAAMVGERGGPAMHQRSRTQAPWRAHRRRPRRARRPGRLPHRFGVAHRRREPPARP